MSNIIGRVLTSTRVLHTRTFYVGSTPTDVDSGTVTVAVKRMDGTTVTQADGNTAASIGNGAYTFRPAAVADVDVHQLVWSGVVAGATVELTDFVDYVGGYLFGLADLRRIHKVDARYSDAALADARTTAEVECERICGDAFVPRFGWCTVYGTGSPWLPLNVGGLAPRTLRSVRAVTVGSTPMDPAVVAGLVLGRYGNLKRPGGAIWPLDTPVRVEFEHGWDYPSAEVPPMVMKRARYMLGAPSSGIPDRATSWTTNEGGTYRMFMPGAENTGDPDVDAVYGRYGGASTRKRSAFA